MTKLKSGIATKETMNQALTSNEFAKMVNYSNNYLKNNEKNLQGYRWIKDALHQWSRQYEYVFTYQVINSLFPQGAKILDAGSGITFFPFFLGTTHEVTCVDADNYINIFNNINITQNTSVRFQQGNLQKLNYEDNSFNVIYCISVLEHTNKYPDILEEFHRVLDSNGLLIITFDISLDSAKYGISESDSIQLYKNISKYFTCDFNINDFIIDDNTFTTKYVATQKQWDLLPWPKPSLKGLLGSLVKRKTTNMNPNIAFCNLICKKKEL